MRLWISRFFPVPSHREEFLPHRAGPASIPLRKLFHPGCALQFAQGSPYFACAFSSYPGKAGDIFFRSGFHIRYRRKMFPEQFCRGRANARQTLQFSAEGLLRPGLSMPSYGKIVRGVAHTLEKEQLRAAFPDIPAGWNAPGQKFCPPRCPHADPHDRARPLPWRYRPQERAVKNPHVLPQAHATSLRTALCTRRQAVLCLRLSTADRATARRVPDAVPPT